MSIQNGINFDPQKSTWECFECSQMYDSNRYQLSIQKYTHIQSSVFFTFVPPLGSIVSIICPLDSKMSVKVDYSIIFWCLFVRDHLGLAYQFWFFKHKYNFGPASKIPFPKVDLIGNTIHYTVLQSGDKSSISRMIFWYLSIF